MSYPSDKNVSTSIMSMHSCCERSWLFSLSLSLSFTKKNVFILRTAIFNVSKRFRHIFVWRKRTFLTFIFLLLTFVTRTVLLRDGGHCMTDCQIAAHRKPGEVHDHFIDDSTISVDKWDTQSHHRTFGEPREPSVISRLRTYQKYPRVYTRTKRYCSFIHYALNYYQDSISNH